ncbi:serine/threonine/tyrosine-interacting protein isoform X2 [Myotis lucifugus]|uniref:serine/threonine/tyrosine-interacting protein isoform X2 n=1 Tax=Myotis lucifugus TaxID=59463 RepID=UPI000CCC2D10|nr:serine/threonine/tyrosine-interacting protein isoform X2 [Myotis lucifugus]
MCEKYIDWLIPAQTLTGARAGEEPATKEWTYPMRREMQEILPGLFLGPYSSAMKSKLPILQKHGVTHIICIRQNIEANFIKPNFQQLFRYLVLDIADNPVENIIRFFPMTKEFIDGSLQTGGKVLVHGNAGISRSAAFVIAYIMETFGMKYRDAFAYVQERRFCINPNAGFVHQLQEYEAIYLAKLTIQMMSPLQIERPVGPANITFVGHQSQALKGHPLGGRCKNHRARQVHELLLLLKPKL